MVAITTIVLPSAVVAFTPIFVEGQVVISEIMYDYPGSEESGKHDWVEIFNSDSFAALLSEWRLRENDSDHQIIPYPETASATLQAGGYAVIASDAATFKTDFPMYTGLLFDSSFSLVSNGETLVMRCCGSSVSERTDRDIVSYIPVDNATDQGNTLQRTSLAGTAFTSMGPTPGTGSLNSSGTTDDASSGSDSSAATTIEQSSESGNDSEDVIMPLSPKIFADGGSDRTVIVGVDTEFRAHAYDSKKNSVDFVNFRWNFGDGSISDKSVVSHRFDYPGRYVVVLTIPEEKESVSSQIIVTVEPIKIVLSPLSDGGVSIENRAGRTLDLSGWILRSMTRTFTLPEHTRVLANSPLRISQRTLGFSSDSDFELAYPSGEFAIGMVPVAAPTSTSPPSVSSSVSPSRYMGQNTRLGNSSAIYQPEAVSEEQSDTSSSTKQESVSQIAGAAAAPASFNVWWIGLIGIAGLAAGSLVLARRFGKNEWDIEEIEESS